MAADDLPTWVHYAQALVAPVVTVVGIVIAWGQFSLARMRLQHDLYDRRYKLYESARKLITQIVREGSASNSLVLSYLRDTSDAIFLLDRAALDYFKLLEKQGFRLVYLNTVIRNEQHPNRSKAIDDEAELLGWWTEQFGVLADKFKPFLQLQRPWLPRWGLMGLRWRWWINPTSPE
jgi:hypothetical protein